LQAFDVLGSLWRTGGFAAAVMEFLGIPPVLAPIR